MTHVSDSAIWTILSLIICSFSFSESIDSCDNRGSVSVVASDLSISSLDVPYTQVSTLEHVTTAQTCALLCMQSIYCLASVFSKPPSMNCKVITAAPYGVSTQVASLVYDANANWIYQSENFNTALMQAKSQQTLVSAYCNPQQLLLKRAISDLSVSFDRPFNEYINGFGDCSSSYWQGLENMHKLTMGGPRRIRFEMRMHNGSNFRSEYASFQVGALSTDYTLYISGFDNSASTGGDPILSVTSDRILNNMPFTANDDNNGPYGSNCAVSRKGGFWFNFCGVVNPNGLATTTKSCLPSSSYDKIHWNTLDPTIGEYCSLAAFKMILL